MIKLRNIMDNRNVEQRINDIMDSKDEPMLKVRQLTQLYFGNVPTGRTLAKLMLMIEVIATEVLVNTPEKKE